MKRLASCWLKDKEKREKPTVMRRGQMFKSAAAVCCVPISSFKRFFVRWKSLRKLNSEIKEIKRQGRKRLITLVWHGAGQLFLDVGGQKGWRRAAGTPKNTQTCGSFETGWYFVKENVSWFSPEVHVSIEVIKTKDNTWSISVQALIFSTSKTSIKIHFAVRGSRTFLAFLMLIYGNACRICILCSHFTISISNVPLSVISR